MLIVLCHPSLLGNLYRTNRISTILGSSNKTHCISMAVILHKRGLVKESKLLCRVQDLPVCEGSNKLLLLLGAVQPTGLHCCRVESGESMQSRGVSVLFLPKFHCELNFIEQ